MNKQILEKNLEALKKLGYTKLNLEKPLDIEKTRDGLYTYRYCIDDNKKVFIHSKYNIKNEINTILDNIDFNKDAVYIVFGLGLGYHIKELQRRISKQSFIFVIEKNWDIVSTYLHKEDITEILNGRLVLLFGNEDEILTRFSKLIFTFDIMPIIGNLNYIILPSYNKIYGEWINVMNKKIIDVIKHAYFNMGNDMKDTIIGIENNFQNIRELIESPSIEILKDKYKNVPGIIVSAGPSLDKNILQLKEAEGKALIIATDAVLSSLKKHNITPDAVTSIERGILTYEKFYKDKDIDERIVFIGPPVVRKEIFEELKDNKKLIVLKQGEMINEWINNDILEENRLLTMGTSCAHVAFAFLQYVGANPIIFVGQDLAYTADGITHSKDVEVKKKVDSNKKENLVYVKGINGEQLPTSRAFKNFLIWYEIQIAEDSTTEYIDATEGGALINGTKLMALEEVIDKYCNEPIERLYDILPKGEFDDIKYNKAIEEVEKLYNFFEEVKEEADIQLSRIDKIERNVIKYNKKLNDKNIDKIIKGINKIAKLERLILSNGVSRTLFQPSFIIFASQMKKLGNDLTDDVIKAKLNIQKKMVISILIGCVAVEKSLKNISENMKKMVGLNS